MVAMPCWRGRCAALGDWVIAARLYPSRVLAECGALALAQPIIIQPLV